MMELVDMPGRSILGSISRLWTCHLKRVGGDFRVSFCDPTEEILKLLFGDIFCTRGDPLKKKTDQLVRTPSMYLLANFLTATPKLLKFRVR